MSYLQKLYETYNNLSKVEDADCNVGEALIPIAHSTQKAHVSVVLDLDGNFIRGEFVADEVNHVKNCSETLVPVTEKSASRSSGVAPHALCDKLKYVAGDYNNFVTIKEPKDKNDAHYAAYLAQLKEWLASPYTTPKVQAIYTYIEKGTLTKDLIDCGIFSVDADGKLTEKRENADVKLTTGIQSEAFIRFVVLGDGPVVNVWEDKALQNAYIDYYLNCKAENSEKEFCCVSGEMQICSENHPQKIRYAGDKAKLISANDKSGFTYRGRFQNSMQAVTIGYEVSQKAHNVLKYLIQKQGERIGNKVFLLWGTRGEKVPKIDVNTEEFSQDAEDFFCMEEEDTSLYADVKEESAKRFNNALLGYKTKLDHDTEYAIIGLDSALDGKGRISVIYYREYFGKQQIGDLLQNIEFWHTTSSWQHGYKAKDGTWHTFYGAPSLYDIARYAFGKQEGDFVKGDGKIVSKGVERLFRSVVDGAKIPRDMVRLLVRKAYCPQNYTVHNWNKLFSVTCSVYKKYLYDYKGEKVDMAIERNCKDISYNCGRLLAVADAIESYALFSKNGTSGARTTNAMRFFTKFCNSPCITWAKISRSLIPYCNALGAKANYLLALKEEISANIDPEEFKQAKNLDGRMALGFDAQRKEIKDYVSSKSNKEDK